jgi:pimeloyl-ACP methyl ester carboxylesterase/DNA-binding CsgD family transcriptional regulator
MYDKFAAVGTAYQLTERQLRMLRALHETGGIREAAAQIGIPYTSARNTVAELKAKLGVATVPMMIGLAGELTPDDPDEGSPAQPRRHDLFSLSERQYAIACKVSTTKSRQEIAEMLGLSEAVLDAEMKEIYLVLGVRSAGELIRVMAEAQQERGRDADLERGHDLPLGNVVRDGRRIGFSDFGPPDGEPVAILHSTITSRAPPTRLVAALQAARFRPLAIDRPGFGDTSPGASPKDPYALAADDFAFVCASLSLARVDVIARGSGQAMMRLGQLHPALVRRAVLVNPTPAIAFTTIDQGPLGAVKRAMAKRPWAVEGMIRLLASYVKPARMHAGMLRAFRESAPDFALVQDDPQFGADYLRATRGFARGNIAGYVTEQSAWAGGLDVAPLPGMTNWRIVQGRHFVLHDPAQAMEYWSARLPDTPVTWVEEAGQMLAYSHPEAVAAALRD